MRPVTLGMRRGSSWSRRSRICSTKAARSPTTYSGQSVSICASTSTLCVSTYLSTYLTRHVRSPERAGGVGAVAEAGEFLTDLAYTDEIGTRRRWEGLRRTYKSQLPMSTTVAARASPGPAKRQRGSVLPCLFVSFYEKRTFAKTGSGQTGKIEKRRVSPGGKRDLARRQCWTFRRRFA